MNKTSLAAAAALIAIASAASAQVTSVTAGQTVSTALPLSGQPGQSVQSSATQLAGGGEGGSPDYRTYQVSTSITPSEIIFADSAITLGTLSSLTTKTDVNITFTNQGSKAIIPTLQSQITPGGFGMYVADPGLNPTFQNGLVGNAYLSPETGPLPTCSGCAPTTIAGFATAPGNYMAPGYEDALAGASFSFKVLSNGVTVEDISGSLTLAYDPSTGLPVETLTLSPQAVAALPSFRLLTSPTDPSALGYQWDASNLSVALGGLLAPGQSDTVTYETAVNTYSFTGANTVFQDGRGNYYIPTQLLAYSGFGDPIGKGGGGGPPAFVPGNFGTGTPGSGAIGDVYFPRFQIGLPSFDSATGQLSLPVSDQALPALPLTYTEAAVPEPSAWALMLSGVGGVGAALRRRARPRTA